MKNSFIDESLVKVQDGEVFIRSRKGRYDSFTIIATEENIIKEAETVCKYCYGCGVDIEQFQLHEIVVTCLECDGTGKGSWLDVLIKEE